jgi:hypothetical protein
MEPSFDLKKAFLAALDKNIDQEQLGKDLVAMVVLPWLEEKAKSSENKVDDALLEGLKKLIT